MEISEVQLTSRLTCPECGHEETETMPTDSCQYFYECQSCKAVFKSLPDDCCVYCSFGTVPCPPIQVARASGNEGDACCA